VGFGNLRGIEDENSPAGRHFEATFLSELEKGMYPTALPESANVVRDDLYEKEQNQLERIDNRIDRLLKRLCTLKATKHMLVSPLLNNHVPQQKKLPTDATAQH
jgi:hypothetical protein